MTEIMAVQPSSHFLARRRHAVSAEPSVVMQTKHDETSVLTSPYYEKPSDAEIRIKIIVKRNILFSHLDDEQLHKLVDAMFEVKVAAGSTVIKQGDEGDNYYVVDSGELSIFVNKDGEEKLVHTALPGGTFGELALMYNCPRAATVKAKTDSILWALDRVTFRRVISETTNRKRRLYETFLENMPILAPLSKFERFKLADVFETAHFEDGDYILKQGDPGDAFYIIEEGEAKVFKSPLEGQSFVELKRLCRGDYFGEIALLTNKPRAANVVAFGPVKCVYLDCDAFVRLLGPCEDLLRKNMELYANIYDAFLDEVSIISPLTKEERRKVARALHPVTFPDSAVIIKQGEPGDDMYIIENGHAIVTKILSPGSESVEVLRLGKGDYFGELALLNNAPRAATVCAKGVVVCAVIKRAVFNALLGPCEQILRRNEKLYEQIENSIMKDSQ